MRILLISYILIALICHIGYTQQIVKVDFIRLMDCIAQAETGHLPEHLRDRAVSPVGAIGRYQIMPFHAKNFGYKVKDLYKPKINKHMAYKIMAWELKKYKNIEQAVAAYNGGGRQARLAQKDRCNETRHYVARVLRMYNKGEK